MPRKIESELVDKAARLQREQEIFLMELKAAKERLEGLESKFRSKSILMRIKNPNE